MRVLLAIIVCVACGYGIAGGTVKSLTDSVKRTSNVLKI